MLIKVDPPVTQCSFRQADTGFGRQFLSRVSILTRDIDIANLYVRLSVTFQYQMKTA